MKKKNAIKLAMYLEQLAYLLRHNYYISPAELLRLADWLIKEADNID